MFDRMRWSVLRTSTPPLASARAMDADSVDVEGAAAGAGDDEGEDPRPATCNTVRPSATPYDANVLESSASNFPMNTKRGASLTPRALRRSPTVAVFARVRVLGGSEPVAGLTVTAIPSDTGAAAAGVDVTGAT